MERISKRKLRRELEKYESRVREPGERGKYTLELEVKEEMLIIVGYYSKNTTPSFMTFQTKEDYTTWDFNEKKWREASIEHISGEHWYPDSKIIKNKGYKGACVFLKEEMQEAKLRKKLYGWKEAETIEVALRKLQEKIRQKRLEERDKKELEPIDEAMELVGELPEDFIEFCKKQMPNYAYYEYNGKEKTMAACSCCRTKFEAEKPRHMKKDICKNCGKEVILKSCKKAPKCEMDYKSVEILQRYKEGIIARNFRVHKRTDKEIVLNLLNGTCISVTEIRRDIYQRGDELNVHRYEYGSYKNRKVRWKYNETEPRWEAVLYTNGLKETLKGTAWEYSGMEEMKEEFCIKNFMEMYPGNRWMEYAIKKGMKKLIKETTKITSMHTFKAVFNAKGKTLNEVLRIEKQDMQLLQELNGGINALRYIREKRAAGGKIQKEAIKKVEQVADAVGYKDIEKIIKKVKEIKFYNYITKKQTLGQEGIRKRLKIWEDYIEMAEILGCDLKDSMILFPRNLKKEHDAAIEALNEKKAREKKEEANKKYQNIKKKEKDLSERYGFESEELMIRPPKEAAEILREGQILHHCVGGYVDKVNNGETVILFMRKKTEPEKPYYTIEVKNGKIQQWYGEYNNARKKKTKEEIEFIRKFEKEKLKNGTMPSERM